MNFDLENFVEILAGFFLTQTMGIVVLDDNAIHHIAINSYYEHDLRDVEIELNSLKNF